MNQAMSTPKCDKCKKPGEFFAGHTHGVPTISLCADHFNPTNPAPKGAQDWYHKDTGSADQSLVIEENTGRNVAVAYDKQDAPLLAAAPALLAALKLHKEFWDTMPKGQLGKIVCDIGILNDAFLATSAAIRRAEWKE